MTAISILSRIYLILALFIGASALVINPWTGASYRDPIINFADVMLIYAYWALGCAAIFLLLFFLLRTNIGGRIGEASLLVATCLLLILSDRLLLAWIGLPHWIPDPQLHYRHRPNVERVNISSNTRAHGTPIHINSWGFHDDEFPYDKEPGQLRGLFVGDSVTMGWGVTRSDAFVNQLEYWLISAGINAQLINAGIEGYATAQARIMAEESMRFQPDFIAIGFCMNDITQPYIVDKEFGGTGTFFDMIYSRSSALDYIANETGFGRCVQKLRSAQFNRRQEDLYVDFDTRAMIASASTTGVFHQGWQTTLVELERIYQLGKEHGIPVYLLVFPYRYQLFDQQFQNPQRILIQHASQLGAYVADFTPLIAEATIHTAAKIADKTALQQAPDYVKHKVYDLVADFYYLDQLHLSQEGHRFVASILIQLLQQGNLIKMDEKKMYQLITQSKGHTNRSAIAIPSTRGALDTLLSALTVLRLQDEVARVEKTFANQQKNQGTD